jgi:uncharacterized protein (TIGR02466 family)
LYNCNIRTLQHIPGGRASWVNAKFFQLQWEAFDATGKMQSPYIQSPALRELTLAMRAQASEFLQLHHIESAQADKMSNGALFVWASVHGKGGCHPPHVHSDSCCTGTYYARCPPGSSPLVLDDPRGKTPFDIMVRIEKNLTTGGGDVDSGYPPFHQQVVVPAVEGQLVMFPPFLVHQVPPCDSAEWRVSFSFNLMGGWHSTVVPELHQPN